MWTADGISSQKWLGENIKRQPRGCIYVVRDWTILVDKAAITRAVHRGTSTLSA